MSRPVESTEASDDVGSVSRTEGVRFAQVDYPGSQRTVVDTVTEAASDIYRSIFSKESKPELENERIFEQVSKLVLSPKLDIQTLQDGFNAILKEHNLPGLKLESFAQPSIPAGGCGDNCAVPKGALLGETLPGEGIIRINERMFKSGNVVQLGKTLMHEANHYFQDILITRALMDDLSKTNPGNLLQAVSDAYKMKYGVEPKMSFLQTIADLRNNTPLNQAERARADYLATGKIAQKQDTMRPNANFDLDQSRRFAEMLKNSGNPESNLEKMSPKEMAQMLYDAVGPDKANDPNARILRRIFFGDEEVSQASLREMFGNPNSDSFDSEKARTALTKLLERRIKSLGSSSYLQFVNYRRYPHEMESYALGESFHAFLRRR